MTTEHGRTAHATAAHLRNGWRLARVGLWVGLFGIAAEAVGMLFGTPPDWQMKLAMLPLWTGAAFMGGTLYSLFLPDSARRDPGPAARARVRTGALAGAVTGALGAVALMVAAPAAVPLPIMAFVELFLVACTAGAGAVGGSLAAGRRAGGPALRAPGREGAEPPRLAEHP